MLVFILFMLLMGVFVVARRAAKRASMLSGTSLTAIFDVDFFLAMPLNPIVKPSGKIEPKERVCQKTRFQVVVLQEITACYSVSVILTSLSRSISFASFARR